MGGHCVITAPSRVASDFQKQKLWTFKDFYRKFKDISGPPTMTKKMQGLSRTCYENSRTFYQHLVKITDARQFVGFISLWSMFQIKFGLDYFQGPPNLWQFV